MKVYVPPIKSQGIKTKLVSWINSIIPNSFKGRWIEPFMGTGVVAFNVSPSHALLCDTNPYIIGFYRSIAEGSITPEIVRRFLHKEGATLLDKGEDHYYAVRERFNKDHQPLDFLFLNRSCFNGIIRFNRKGDFNVPFCHKPQRFVQSYITKIVNQVAYISAMCHTKEFMFKCQGFEQTVLEGRSEDIIYCDPPYINRHVDYYNGWDGDQERALYRALSKTTSKFILSTWHHNDFRKNEYIEELWSRYNILTRKHFYHVGAREKNRNAMIEAIVTNYNTFFYEDQQNDRKITATAQRTV